MTILVVFFIGFSVAWYFIRAEELLLQNKETSRLQRFLGLTFVWWGLSTLKDLLLYVNGDSTDELLRHIFYFDSFGAVTFAVLLAELTMPNWVTARRVACMVSPFLLFFVAHFFLTSPTFDIVFTVFFVSFALAAVGVAIVKGKQYARNIRDTYSNLEDVDISWLWHIVALFAASQLIWWAVADSFDFVADTVYYASTLLCWQLTLRRINQMRSLRLAESINEEAVSDDFHMAQRGYSVSLAGQLEQLMDTEQLYLNPELTLTMLVKRLNTNRTYLSRYISNDLNTTFYDYINSLRIERKVIPMMQEGNMFTLEYIAEQAGFRSITTFRRAFKKLTGMLPSEYIQQDAQKADRAQATQPLSVLQDSIAVVEH